MRWFWRWQAGLRSPIGTELQASFLGRECKFSLLEQESCSLFLRRNFQKRTLSSSFLFGGNLSCCHQDQKEVVNQFLQRPRSIGPVPSFLPSSSFFSSPKSLFSSRSFPSNNEVENDDDEEEEEEEEEDCIDGMGEYEVLSSLNFVCSPLPMIIRYNDVKVEIRAPVLHPPLSSLPEEEKLEPSEALTYNELLQYTLETLSLPLSSSSSFSLFSPFSDQEEKIGSAPLPGGGFVIVNKSQTENGIVFDLVNLDEEYEEESEEESEEEREEEEEEEEEGEEEEQRKGKYGSGLLDFRYPHSLFPTARQMKRKIIFHCGPTNSGKTHAALSSLSSSKSGVYCGPLRLLAQEVYSKLNSQGVSCWLRTGQQYLDQNGRRIETIFAESDDSEIEEDEDISVKFSPFQFGEKLPPLLTGEDLSNDSLSPSSPSLSSPSSSLSLSQTQEQEETFQDCQHISCTVEMMDISRVVETVVIDEIQMIGDESRGWAWTRCLLGAPASVVHVCGSPSALQIVQRILDQTGEELEIIEYDRLSPLEMGKQLHSKKWIEQLKSGDCVVAFSRREILRLKKEIERYWEGKRYCGVVYGSLPPPSRVSQAEMFNESGNNVDFLVASDAIGMGLNLNIQRIVFSRLRKFDGEKERLLYDDEIKQIAGRAGRFRSKFPNGYVTALDRKDFQRTRRALRAPHYVTKKAGIFPSVDHLELVNSYLIQMMKKKGRFSFVGLVELFEDNLEILPHYFVCDCTDMKYVASLIDDLKLSLRQKYMFSVAPVDIKSVVQISALYNWARLVSEGRDVPFHYSSRRYFTSHLNEHLLKTIEEMYKLSDLYIWLANRSPFFPNLKRAEKFQHDCCSLVDENLTYKPPRRSARRMKKQEKTKEKRKIRHNRRMAKSKLKQLF